MKSLFIRNPDFGLAVSILGKNPQNLRDADSYIE